MSPHTVQNLDEIPPRKHYKRDGRGVAFHELAAITLT